MSSQVHAVVRATWIITCVKKQSQAISLWSAVSAGLLRCLNPFLPGKYWERSFLYAFFYFDGERIISDCFGLLFVCLLNIKKKEGGREGKNWRLREVLEELSVLGYFRSKVFLSYRSQLWWQNKFHETTGQKWRDGKLNGRISVSHCKVRFMFLDTAYITPMTDKHFAKMSSLF